MSPELPLNNHHDASPGALTGVSGTISPSRVESIFGKAAELYHRYRPGISLNSAKMIAAITPGHDLALDVATGTGQVAARLLPHFSHVIGIDHDPRLIAEALRHSTVDYRVGNALQLRVDSGSVDLLTVGNALHWFDQAAFWKEVERVLKPGGVLAVLQHKRTFTGSKEFDELVEKDLGEILRPYGDPRMCAGRKNFEMTRLPFPSGPAVRDFVAFTWALTDFKDYLGTMSQNILYREVHGEPPTKSLDDRLSEAWGEEVPTRRVVFPYLLRTAIKPT